jgi:hypothetical protein
MYPRETMTHNPQNEIFAFEGPQGTWLSLQQHQAESTAYSFDLETHEWCSRDGYFGTVDDTLGTLSASSISPSQSAHLPHLSAADGIAVVGECGVSGDMQAALLASSHEYPPYVQSFDQQQYYPTSQDVHPVYSFPASSIAPSIYATSVDLSPEYKVIQEHGNSTALGLAAPHDHR